MNSAKKELEAEVDKDAILCKKFKGACLFVFGPGFSLAGYGIFI